MLLKKYIAVVAITILLPLVVSSRGSATLKPIVDQQQMQSRESFMVERLFTAPKVRQEWFTKEFGRGFAVTTVSLIVASFKNQYGRLKAVTHDAKGGYFVVFEHGEGHVELTLRKDEIDRISITTVSSASSRTRTATHLIGLRAAGSELDPVFRTGG